MAIYFFYICLASVFWGTTGTTLVLLNRVVEVSPLSVGFWRMAIAAPILLFAASRLPGFWRSPSRFEVTIYLLLGACTATFQLCYFNAVPLAGVAITALVAICSAPLFIALIAPWKLGEQLAAKDYVALFIGIVGTIMLIAGPAAAKPQLALSTGPMSAVAKPLLQGTAQPSFQTSRAGGICLALLAGLAYALYVVISKVAIRQVPPIKLAAFGFSTAALWLLPVWTAVQLNRFQSLVRTSSPTAAPAANQSSWALSAPFLLYLGAATTALAYWLFLVSLQHVPATVSGILTLIEPLTATLLGTLVFRESLGRLGIAGAGLLLGAIALLTINPTSNQ